MSRWKGPSWEQPVGLWDGTHPAREVDYPCPGQGIPGAPPGVILKPELLLPLGAILCEANAHVRATDCAHTGQVISVPLGRFCAMGRCSRGGRWGFWGLVPKQAGGAQTVSPGSISRQCPSHLLASGSLQVSVATTQPTVQGHCGQDSGTQADTRDINRDAHCSLVTPSPHSWGVVGPAASQPPPPSPGHRILGPCHPRSPAVTRSREERHDLGHDLNPRIPGSLRDQHRDGDHMQLWDSGDVAGGQWCAPGEP